MSLSAMLAGAASFAVVVRLGDSARKRPTRLPVPPEAPDPGHTRWDRLARVPRIARVAVSVVVVAVVVHPVVGLAIGVCVWGAPVIRSRRTRAQHDRAVRDGLPDVVDLLRLAIGSGMNIRLALDAVGPRCPAVFADGIDEVNRRITLGQPLAVALEVLDGLGEPLVALTRGLVAADLDGAPLGPTLDRIADEARTLRTRDAQEHARRLPVKLLFPLVMCIMPAFIVLSVIPLLGGAIGSLSL